MDRLDAHEGAADGGVLGADLADAPCVREECASADERALPYEPAGESIGARARRAE